METQIDLQQPVDDEADEEFVSLLLESNRLVEQEDYITARTRLEAALRLRPANERCRNMLGQVYFKTGQWEPAAGLYEQLVLQHPQEATLRINLALVFLKQGNTERARTELEEVIRYHPTHAKAQTYLGRVYQKLNELQLAYWAFLRAGNQKLADEVAAKMRATGQEPLPPATPIPPPQVPPPSEIASALTLTPQEPPPALVQQVAAPVLEDGVISPEPEPAFPPFGSAEERPAMWEPLPTTSPGGDNQPMPSVQEDSLPPLDPLASGPPLDLPDIHPPPSLNPPDADRPVESIGWDSSPTAPDSRETPPRPTSSMAARVDAGLEARPPPGRTLGDTLSDLPFMGVPRTSPSLPPSLMSAQLSSAMAALDDDDDDDSDSGLFGRPRTVVSPAAGGSPEVPGLAALTSPPRKIPTVPPVPVDGPSRSVEPLELEDDGLEIPNAITAVAHPSTSNVPLTAEQWATDRCLKQPTQPFASVAPGLLGLRIHGAALIRSRALAAAHGDVRGSPATRASPGESSAVMGGEEDPLVLCRGEGWVALDPDIETISTLAVEEGTVTVLESAVFGCSSGMQFDAISMVVDGTPKPIPAVSFRGEGVVAMRSPLGIRAIACSPGKPLTVSMEHLLAFSGALQCVPARGLLGQVGSLNRKVMGFSGEGVVFVRTGTRV